jgi:hypothetical protein
MLRKSIYPETYVVEGQGHLGTVEAVRSYYFPITNIT